jgi:hypothetical protein
MGSPNQQTEHTDHIFQTTCLQESMADLLWPEIDLLASNISRPPAVFHFTRCPPAFCTMGDESRDRQRVPQT